MKISDRPPEYGSPINKPPSIEIPPLPTGVALRTVYTDFLKYIYNHTHHFFVENTPAGGRIWDRLHCTGAITFVLAMPNGWEADQQIFLRDVAISAEFIKKAEAEERLKFVTEGEASVHYALAHTQSRSWLRVGTLFAVSDAGGSTVDTTLYECKNLEPLKLEEVCASECVQVSSVNYKLDHSMLISGKAGGVFIDRAASNMLSSKLRNSRFGNEEFIKLMTTEFEKKVLSSLTYLRPTHLSLDQAGVRWHSRVQRHSFRAQQR
jgi:hypothetical protein